MKVIRLVALSIPYQTSFISNSQTPKMNIFAACSQIEDVQTEINHLVFCQHK